MASYGMNYHEFDRLSAKYVHWILVGTQPADLPVERIDRLELVLNLRKPRDIGLTLPQSLLVEADKVIR